MIERASRDSRLVPGDVLGGGTVTGGSIGEAIRIGFPARYLEPGDVVEIEVEGIGVLRNTIAPKSKPQPKLSLQSPGAWDFRSIALEEDKVVLYRLRPLPAVDSIGVSILKDSSDRRLP